MPSNIMTTPGTVPKFERSLEATVENYLDHLRRLGRSHVTLRAYRSVITGCLRDLHGRGLNWRPAKITPVELDVLRRECWAHTTPRVNRWYLAVLGSFLTYSGNSVMSQNRYDWPQDERINVRWLTLEQSRDLMNAARGMERIVIHHLMLCMMRRVEVLRLTTESHGPTTINVLGKGRMGGKWRTIPHYRVRLDEGIVDLTQIELNLWMSERERILQRFRRLYPGRADPKELLLYNSRNAVGPVKSSNLVDSIVRNLSHRLGFHCSPHVLRRTGARNAYDGGTDLKTIQNVLGHRTSEQTERYIGIRADAMDRGMQTAAAYFLGAQKPGILEIPPLSLKRPTGA
jgi:integrase